MAEFLFVGSLALIFATLSVLFVIVVVVVLYCIFDEIRSHILIFRLGRAARKMTKISEEMQNADTVAFFVRTENYYNGV